MSKFTINKYLIGLLAILLFSLTSCSGGGEESDPTPTPDPTPTNSDERWDAQTVTINAYSTSQEFQGTDTIIPLVLKRSTSSGDLKMNLIVSARSGKAICSLPDSGLVTFADGVTQMTVNLTIKGMEMETTDTIDVRRTYIATDKGSKWTGTTTTLAFVPLKSSYLYESLGTARYASTAWSTYDVVPVEWDVTVMKLKDHDIYKVKNCYENGNDIIFVCNGDSVTVDYQKGWFYSTRYGDVYLQGTGIRNGKVLTTNLTFTLPSVNYSFGTYRETLTLP